jgi:hypothetical protein
MTEGDKIYNDLEHWKRRRDGQISYLDNVYTRYLKGEIDMERRQELFASAKNILTLIQNRIYDLRLQARIPVGRSH